MVEDSQILLNTNLIIFIKYHRNRPHLSNRYWIELSSLIYCRRHVNQDYDEHVLSTGEFDERVFLGNAAINETATPSKHLQPSEGDFDETGR